MNRQRFQYMVVPAWPALAWLSRCQSGSDVVEVFHGLGVETTEEWFGEVIWAGEFTQGGFDQTDIIAGSGGRARERGIVFVSSGSTVDRLQSLTTADGVWLSNSLCCLLTMAGGSLDPTYPHFHADFSSINKGLSQYKRHIDSSVGQVELTYFDNLLWTGMTLEHEPKPLSAPEFTSFEAYRDFLGLSMHAFANNAVAATRHQRFQPLCALSNGYDSPTVGVIARNFGGCQEALSFDVGRDECDDSGETIARYLGMNCTVIPRGKWQSLEGPEIPFIAGTPSGSDVLWAGAEPQLSGTVLFTGFYGDAVWAKDAKYRVSDLARGDGSGRSLTEYRLQAKFIHCPVPFWGSRRGQELMVISRSSLMQAWDLLGNYSRPICRRIVEEAGIPRELFGVGKRGVSVELYRPEIFLTPTALKDYHAWLRKNRKLWIRKFQIPPIPVIAKGVDTTLSILIKSLSTVEGWIPPTYGLNRFRSILKRITWKIRSIQIGVKAPPYLRRYTFPWAIEHEKIHFPVQKERKGS